MRTRGLLLAALLVASVSSVAAVEPRAGHVVLRVVADDDFRISVRAYPEGPLTLVAALYRDGVLEGSSTTFVSDADVGASVEVGPIQREMPIVRSSTSTWVGTAALGFEPGVYYAVLAVFGETSHWWWEVTAGTPEVSVHSGGPTHSFSSSPHGGGTWAEAQGAGAHVFAADGKRVDFAIQHRLMGWFAQGPFVGSAHVGTSTLTTPDGSLACPCILDDLAASPPPGAYRFDLRGASASAARTPYVAWADVDIPLSG